MIRRLILTLLFVAALGLPGCGAVRLSASIAGEGIGTACKVTGHALGAACSALCLSPGGVLKHAFGAAADTVGGAADITGTAICETFEILD